MRSIYYRFVGKPGNAMPLARVMNQPRTPHDQSREVRIARREVAKADGRTSDQLNCVEAPWLMFRGTQATTSCLLIHQSVSKQVCLQVLTRKSAAKPAYFGHKPTKGLTMVERSRQNRVMMT